MDHCILTSVSHRRLFQDSSYKMKNQFTCFSMYFCYTSKILKILVLSLLYNTGRMVADICGKAVEISERKTVLSYVILLFANGRKHCISYIPDYGCVCSLDKRAINHFPPLLVNLFGDALYLSYYFLNFACRIYFRLVYHNSNACQKVSVLFFVTKITHFLATTMRFSRLKSNEFDWFPIFASQVFFSVYSALHKGRGEVRIRNP